jgi:hypothetical protein
VSEQGPEAQDLEAALARAHAVKQEHEADLLSKSNVVGVGVGLCMRGGVPTGEVGLVVLVRSKLHASELSPDDVIPSEIQSVPVDVQEVGDIRPAHREP